MSFKNCTILHQIKNEEGNIIQHGTIIYKDEKDKIIKILIRAELEDTIVTDKKEFDFIIEGETLESMRSNLFSGIEKLLKEKASLNYTDWEKELSKLKEPTALILDDIQKITDELGIVNITSLS